MGDHPLKKTGEFAAGAAAAITTPLAAGGGIIGAKGGEKAGAEAEKALAPDLPQPEDLPDAPTLDNAAVNTATDEAASKQRRARGLASTIFTSGAGAGGMLTTARKTLLGS